ncbi:MAG: S8 family serine peptidase, partial [Ardenticatenaceae bacterium]|nr:S8 family serine peptidase [Ardenticatenaceae bacterium]
MNAKSKMLGVMSVFAITLALLALMLSTINVGTTFAESNQSAIVKGAVVVKSDAAPADKGNTGPAIYIVVLQDEPLVAYKGGIDGLAATNPQARGENKLDVDSADSVAYLNYLAQKRGEALAAVSGALGRNAEAIYEYQATLNGFAVELTAAEAAVVAGLPEVKFLERELQFELETDAGPAWIGAPGIWNGTATGGLPGTMGEGIIVGVIDTGIDPWNPSFADVGGDGYDHTNPWGSGTYVGVCDPGDPTYDPTFICNDKLIGAWGYPTVNGGDPRDSDGHGSHTSSTSAGNFVYDTVITTTTQVFTASISGVAPHANVIMYAACCAGSALSAARDQAVLDGVNVVNYSIGASVPTANPWSDAESQQWLNMRDAGIFVATSAGNNGPNDATLFRPGDIPWLTAVAASTHNRAFLNSLTVSDGVTASITLDGESMTGPLSTPAEVVFSSWYTLGGTIDPEDARLCGSSSGNPFPPGTFNGEIVVCERGIYGRVEKGQNVAAAGAGGYILAQPDEFGGGPGSLASDPHVLPAVHIDYYEYQDLLNYMANASGTVSGTIAGSILDIDDAHGDILASFSSRGPNSAPLLPDILKPQVAAPGRAIWAAYHQGAGGDGTYTYNVIQGTSMASPHVAGAGALLMALHPEWTPSMIESAMATTANTNVFNDDGINQATPFGIGSGRVDLEAAAQAGFVLDVTTAEFQAANPGTGGDPKALNLSSMANADCQNTCSWTRTVSSTQGVAVTWTASVQAPAGMTLTVDPPSFVLPAYGTQSFTVTADVTNMPVGQWNFGEVGLASPALDVAIPDDGYDGSLGSMLGRAIDASGIPGASTVVSVEVEAAIDHTWIGDLVIKLVSPDGSVLGLVSRPGLAESADDGTGCCGDSANLVSTSPIRFYDGASKDAETMGDLNTNTNLLICQDDGECDYSPNPGSIATPPSNFADLVGENASGTWTLYVGDSVSADPGQLQSWSIRITHSTGVFVAQSAPLPPAHFPVAVVAGGEPPAIEIPAGAESTQVLDVAVVKPFTITNNGGNDLNWSIFEDTTLQSAASLVEGSSFVANGGWSDDFDSYATGAQLHGMGGWFGWGNDVTFGALTSNAQARSNPNSVDINTNSDLVHPYTQTSGVWTYTAWQYIPSGLSGTSDFIMLNQYDDACTTCNWSVQVEFDGGTGLMTDAGSGNTMSYVADAWAKIEVVIDLDADTQTFLYNGVALYTDVWNGYISGAGGGSNAIAVVDLFANGASSVYYDDLSLTPGTPTVATACQIPNDISWLDVSPASGTTVSGTSSIVDLTFDSTGLSAGVYTGTLCVTSDDPINPLVSAPVTMTVLAQAPPDIAVNPANMASSQTADTVVTQTLEISNVGESLLVWTIEEDMETGANGRTSAATVFLNQPPNQSNGSFSDVDCDLCAATGTQVLAENFVLANSSVITGMTIWSGYFPSNTPLVQDDLTVIFHADNNGTPGATLSTETSVPYTRMTTGIVLFGVNEYEHTITLANPVALDAGTYWVEIYNDTTGST